MMKKILLVLLLICVPLSLFATGRSQSPTSATGSLPLVEFDWYTRNYPQPDEAMVFQAASNYFVEKINAKVNFINMSYNDWFQRYPIMLNSGTAQGVLQYGGSGSTYVSDVNNGAYMPLDNLLDQYAPATKALFNSTVWDAMKINGSIYGIPSLKDNAYIMGSHYNATMAERLGINMSNIKWTNFVNLEPFFMDVIQKRKQLMPQYGNHPLITDIGAIYPFHFRVESFTGNTPLAVTNLPGIMDIAGYDTETVFNLFETREFLNFAKTMARYAANDIINETATGVDWDAADGGFFWWNTWGVVIVAEHRISDDFVSKIILPEKVWSDTSNFHSAGVAISSGFRNPERAMMAINLMNTDPYIATLMRFGIEGQHYIYNSAGKKTMDGSPRNSNAAARGYLSWYGAFLGNVTIVDAPESHGGVDNAVGKMLVEYNRNASMGHMGFIFNTQSVEPIVAACNAVFNEYQDTIRLGMLPENQVEAYVAEFTQKLRANGIQTIISEAQRQLNAWKAARR